MSVYLKSVDYDIWDTVENGYTLQLCKVDNQNITKNRDEWDLVDKNNFSLNAKAMNILISSLNKIDYIHISHCLTA